MFVNFLASSLNIFASGQVVVGGLSEEDKLSSVEIFPSPPTRTCSVPDLPRGRQGSGREGHRGHSLSFLSGGKLVVCGGNKLPSRVAKFCFAWTTSNTSWTHLHTMRSSSILFLSQNNSTVLHFYNSKVGSEGWAKIIDFLWGQSPNFGGRTHLTGEKDASTWGGLRHLFLTPLCCSATLQHRPLPRLCQVLRSGQVFTFSVTGGGAFELHHSGDKACGVADEDTIVMTGGCLLGLPTGGCLLGHQYVTRWVGW